jgi:carbamoyl-phosphate synthase large subunit
MRTILVSGASGIVGYGILRSLRESGIQLRLVGTSMYDDSVAPAFCDVFELAPPTDGTAYIDWLSDTIRKHHVDLVIPGIEIDMYEWTEHLPEIEASGAVALLNCATLVRLCGDKWAAYEDLSGAGFGCAIESSLSNDFDAISEKFGLPFLLKPRRGFGSKGLVRVGDFDTFSRHQQEVGPVLMAQPLVGDDDEEYTTSAFCDGQGGFYASMALKRRLSRGGFTEKATVVPADEFADTISGLCEHFRPLGPTNFQFRKCADGMKLLEINPRISSSTSIRTAFGYNESSMAVEYFLEGRTPVQPAIRPGRAVRYTTEYVWYGDSIHI